MSKTLITFWLALTLAPGAGAIAAPAAPQSGASEGAKVNLTFANLDPGKTYSYYVVAVDIAGNRSAPSEIVTEKAP